MRKALNLSTGIITAVILVTALVASGFVWWLNERASVLEGNVPLMPRSEVVHAEKRLGAAAEIYNYRCRTWRTAAQTKRFYLSHLADAGWSVIEKTGSAVQLEKDDLVFRLVLHQQKHRTVFTLHMRHHQPKNK